MKIGILGSGKIGGTLTRRLSAAGHDVSVANTRGPESLRELAQETGATPTTPEEAISGAELVVVAVPLHVAPDLPSLDGKLVVDANNYYPGRDGQIGEIDAGKASSRWLADHHPGATVTKAFNTINWRNLLADGRPHGDPDRIAIPVAGDDEEAKATVSGLVDEIGFDPVDSGSLDDSRRQEPGTPVYGANLDAEKTRAALAAA